MEHLGVRELRDQVGRHIDEAFFRGKHTVIEKNGEPRAVLVPYEWWQQHYSDDPSA
ncbi:type II toxin-antitoxin system Phd/YefM family antitoxin [Streptosporangium vulgare]|uniref:Antitoxin n=1 Tax=Streptosporangium vulgare TaxID=46190 RepID=A0ABV5TQ15_9ACTN